jgi:DNA-binding transcriptional LysR family regulator
VAILCAHRPILGTIRSFTTSFPIDWATWLRTAGITDVDPHRGPMFHSSEYAVQAAIQGEGVILGRSALVADDLASGRPWAAITDDLGQRSLFLLLLTAAVELTLYSFFKLLKFIVRPN